MRLVITRKSDTEFKFTKSSVRYSPFENCRERNGSFNEIGDGIMIIHSPVVKNTDEQIDIFSRINGLALGFSNSKHPILYTSYRVSEDRLEIAQRHDLDARIEDKELTELQDPAHRVTFGEKNAVPNYIFTRFHEPKVR